MSETLGLDIGFETVLRVTCLELDILLNIWEWYIDGFVMGCNEAKETEQENDAIV